MSIIGTYSSHEIRRFLKHHYGIDDVSLSQTNHGLDNSVFLLQPTDSEEPIAVLKIVETKRKQDIENGINISMSLGECIHHIEYWCDKNGNVVSALPGNHKPCYVYRYIKGNHPEINTTEKSEQLANLLKSLHGLGKCGSVPLQSLLEKEYRDISQYWTKEVEAGCKRDFPERFDFYTQAISRVCREFRLSSDTKITCPVGITHSDLTPSNIIETNDGDWICIDFDGATKSGYQLVDVAQAISKSELSDNNELLKAFIECYFSDTNDSVIQDLNLYISAFCIKAMLSTDYYTYNIPKLSPAWSKEHATNTLNRLQKSFENAMSK